MTMRRAIIYAVLLAAVVALWLFTHSEKAQIRRVFTDIERLATKFGKFLSHLEKTDSQWLFSRIKVP